MRNMQRLFFVLSFICLFSCKAKGDKNLIKNRTIQKDTVKVENQNQKSIFIRLKDETTEEFIKKMDSAAVYNHPIIETDNWINNTNTIFVFKYQELEDDLGKNVVGNVYLSKDKKEYFKLHIDDYEPEGNNAKIETVFFYNVDEDDNKELIILCSWEQRLKGTSEGKLYQTFIYDYNKQKNTINYLEKISNHFRMEFDGIREGETINAKFNSAKDIIQELKKYKEEKR